MPSFHRCDRCHEPITPYRPGIWSAVAGEGESYLAVFTHLGECHAAIKEEFARAIQGTGRLVSAHQVCRPYPHGPSGDPARVGLRVPRPRSAA